MRKLTPIIFVLSLLLLLGCIQEKQPQNQNILVLGKDLEDVNTSSNTIQTPKPSEPKIISLLIKTDKPSYVSREKINVNIELLVEGEIPGVRVYFYGIRNRFGNYLLDQNQLMYLRQGLNTANFTVDLPYCSACSGMPADTYYIFAKAVKDNQTLLTANCSFNFSA